MARRAVEHELSRERIMDAARHLFVTKGYRSISMRSIGQHLGYSHGSLYYHFKEKAELFYAIVLQDFQVVSLLFDQVMNSPPVQDLTQIELLMLEFIKYGLDHPHQYEMMFMLRDEEIISYCQREQTKCYDHFSALIQRSLEQEHISSDICLSIPLSLFLGMHGFISYYIHNQTSFEQIQSSALSHVKFLSSMVPRQVQSH